MVTTTRHTHDASVLHLEGRLTAARPDERLPHRVQRLIDSGVRQLVLDLRGVSYMDSTCLGEIIEVAQMLRRYGGRLTLINIPPRVQRLLDISHITDAQAGLVH